MKLAALVAFLAIEGLTLAAPLPKNTGTPAETGTFTPAQTIQGSLMTIEDIAPRSELHSPSDDNHSSPLSEILHKNPCDRGLCAAASVGPVLDVYDPQLESRSIPFGATRANDISQLSVLPEATDPGDIQPRSIPSEANHPTSPFSFSDGPLMGFGPIEARSIPSGAKPSDLLIPDKNLVEANLEGISG